MQKNVLSPLATMYQTQLEVSRRCAEAVFSGTEKIDRVMIGATHRAFTEQLDFVQAIATVRDPQSVGSTLQSRFLSRTPDDALNYQTEIMRIVAEMQNDIGKSLQNYVEELGANAAGGAFTSAEGSREKLTDTAFNPMTSMFSVWESAFKEVASLTKKNMMVARSTMEETASKAMQRAGSTITAGNGAHEGAGEEEKRGSSSSGGGKKK
ncbi:MAG: phasin family protein [Noviherbaspirillum sp.]